MADVTASDVRVFTWLSNPVGATASDTAINLTQADAANPTGNAALVAPRINAMASATVRGSPGDDLEAWRFGFTQLRFVSDEWAQYRGRTMADGSLLLARDRPPALPQQVCRDTFTIGDPDGDDVTLELPPIF